MKVVWRFIYFWVGRRREKSLSCYTSSFGPLSSPEKIKAASSERWLKGLGHSSSEVKTSGCELHVLTTFESIRPAYLGTTNLPYELFYLPPRTDIDHHCTNSSDPHSLSLSTFLIPRSTYLFVYCCLCIFFCIKGNPINRPKLIFSLLAKLLKSI